MSKTAEQTTEGGGDTLEGQQEDKSLEGGAGGEAGLDVVVEDTDFLPKSETVPLKTLINERKKWQKKANEEGKSIDALKTELELMRMMHSGEGKKGAAEMPTFESCDYDEDEFRRQLVAYAKEQSVEEARQAVREELSQNVQDQANSQREQRVNDAFDRHYQEAEKLGVSDFAEAENKVIEIFGKENAEHLIASSSKSHQLVYWLGKNPDKAQYYANLVAQDALSGAMALGQLEGKLKAKPRNTDNFTPDEPLSGGGTPTTEDGYKRKLKKIRTERKPGWTKESLALQEEARKAGFTGVI
jgi:hypothetical protein